MDEEARNNREMPEEWKSGEKIRSFFKGEIFLTLPGWKRRAFTVRLRPGRKPFPDLLFSFLKEKNFSATCFVLPELLEEYAGKFPGKKVLSLLPDLTEEPRPLTEARLGEIRKKFEACTKSFCSGVLLGIAPDGAEKALLSKKSLLFAATSSSSGSCSLPLDPFFLQNTAVNGAVPEEAFAAFRKSDPYGGVFAYFSLLLTGEITEALLKEKIFPVLEGMDPEGILCMTDEEFVSRCRALRSLRTSVDGSMAENVSHLPLSLIANGRKLLLSPGETLFMKRKDASPSAHLHPVREEDWLFHIAPPEKEVLPEGNAGDFPDGTVFFPGGYRKALSFSYDDGNVRDGDLVQILNRYGMKGTFNLCSCVALDLMKSFGEKWSISTYDGHEIAGHGLYHYTFSALPPSPSAFCLYGDRMVLETLTGKILCGHAFPNGTSSGGVPDVLSFLAASGYIYARGSKTTHDFRLPENFLLWEQTCMHKENLMELADKFLEVTGKEELAVFTVLGHVSEFVNRNNFDLIETFCRKLAGKEKKIWYATNKEICEYVLASRALLWAEDRSFVKNVSSKGVLLSRKGKFVLLAPGETVSF